MGTGTWERLSGNRTGPGRRAKWELARTDPSDARQVDSHMDFDKRWDATLMGQWEETQNDRARSTVSKSTRFPCRSRGPLGSRAQRVASRNRRSE